ncbi:transglycosylase domain-containing protein [Leptospira interrogans]
MNDWFFKQGGRDRIINWLGIDAWIDSTLAETWERIKSGYDALSSFFARFRLTGFKRLLNEAASEGLTLGVGGLVVLYGLAIPAFHEVEDGKWLTTGQYSVKFLDKDGNEIGKRGINLDDAVPLEEIPDYMIKATLATEDRRFYDHFGLDVIGTLRALSENLRASGVVQGGSSLSQQLAKNLFLSSERSLQRKIKEAFLAVWLESRLTKNEILKLYLDRAYMGGGAFGVEAASQFYFGKSVREINMAEAAILAGLYKAPTKYAPHIDLAAARARANVVLNNLVEAGFYTAGQVHHARLAPARIVETRQTASPDWFLDYAYDEIQRLMEGKGHFTITAKTTIDLSLQRAGEQALVSTIRQRGRSMRADSGALVAMETDGAVRVLVGGVDYGESQFNRATKARRQPGSSFKVYVYASALENGYRPDTIVRDASRACGNWHPQNYGGSHGTGARMPLWMALAKSYNTIAAELSFAVGREKVIELTERLGISGIKRTCSMALGDYGISPLEHTGGIATFANGGKRATPYAITEVFTANGDLVYSRERDEPPAPQIVERRVAEQMNQMMQKVVTEGTGQRAALDFTYSVGKTGTSTGPKDIWFVGFTGKYVGSVWIGNDDNRPMANGTTGGQMASPVWQAFMAVAHTDKNIPPIPGLPVHPVQVAEQQRLAELRRSEGVLAAQPGGRGRSSAMMPDQTRDALKKIVQSLRKATGTTDEQPDRNRAPERASPASLTPDRRAEVSDHLRTGAGAQR